MAVQRAVIEERVNRSVERLLDHDSALLERDVHEQTVSHKLGEYLQQEFSEWNVDCEYNKHHEEVKELSGYDADRVRPDVIVHRRGTDENLLVVEVKLSSNSDESIEEDRRKVKLYTEGVDLEYEFGFFAVFQTGEETGVGETQLLPEED